MRMLLSVCGVISVTKIEGFQCLLATAMLVFSLHGAVMENTTKCPVTFYLVQTTIPNHIVKSDKKLSDKNISTHTRWKF